jgi:serine protease
MTPSLANPLRNLAAAALLVAATLTPAAHAAEAGPARTAVRSSAGTPVVGDARVIVKYRADSGLVSALASGSGESAAAGPQQARALAARLGMPIVDGRPMGPRMQLVTAKGWSSHVLAARIAEQADIEYAVVDERVRIQAAPNDPYYVAPPGGATPAVGQWYLRARNSATIVDATSIVAAIDAEAAWNVTTGRSTVVVAVLDTGIRGDHPDLAAKLLPGYDFISDPGAANDGEGRDADPTDPGDGVTNADVGVVRGCISSDVANSSWHGTQTAGLIGAATNNGVGMASVGRDVMLLPVRVLGKCGGDTSDVIDALKWAGGIAASNLPPNPNPAKIINLSFGSSNACSAAYTDVFQQLAAKGVTVVAAAGNEGLAVGSPANCANVIAVGGVRHAGTKVGYSDLGPEIAISAPAGNCVNATGACLYPLLTTANDGLQGPGNPIYTDGTSRRTLGTSFSAPLVAGTAALMVSVNPLLSPGGLLTALKASARPFPTTGAGTSVGTCTAPTATAQGNECYCTTATCGAGLLDAGAAVTAVAAVSATINVASTSVLVGSAVTLDGSAAQGGVGATIASYQWTITSGSTIAAFTSATNAATATLVPSAAGSVTVTLTVVDTLNRSASASTTLTVTAPAPAPVVLPPVTTTTSGGAGAMEPGWLLGWLASVVAVWRVTPRTRRRPG